MADEKNASPTEGRVEVGYVPDTQSSVELRSGEKPVVTNTANTEAGLEFDLDGEGTTATGVPGLKDGEEAPEGSDKPEGTEEATTGEAPEESAEAPEDLGAWDPDNAEVATKFDERYFAKDGSELNMAAFSSEVAANAAKEDGTPVLNEGTYGWLKDRMGVSKEAVDKIIAGQVALGAQNEDAFYKTVGGKEVYASKLDWAKRVYTAEQKARFNAAIDAGGDAAQEALELLNARWEKAGNKAPATKQEGAEEEPAKRRPGLPAKRAASPAKSTAAAPGGTAAAAAPFASADEHRKAMAEAMKSGDKSAMELVRKRLLASPWFRK